MHARKPGLLPVMMRLEPSSSQLYAHNVSQLASLRSPQVAQLIESPWSTVTSTSQKTVYHRQRCASSRYVVGYMRITCLCFLTTLHDPERGLCHSASHIIVSAPHGPPHDAGCVQRCSVCCVIVTLSASNTLLASLSMARC